jgi:hypothetical protein
LSPRAIHECCRSLTDPLLVKVVVGTKGTRRWRLSVLTELLTVIWQRIRHLRIRYRQAALGYWLMNESVDVFLHELLLIQRADRVAERLDGSRPSRLDLLEPGEDGLQTLRQQPTSNRPA